MKIFQGFLWGSMLLCGSSVFANANQATKAEAKVFVDLNGNSEPFLGFGLTLGTEENQDKTYFFMGQSCGITYNEEEEIINGPLLEFYGMTYKDGKRIDFNGVDLTNLPLGASESEKVLPTNIVYIACPVSKENTSPHGIYKDDASGHSYLQVTLEDGTIKYIQLTNYCASLRDIFQASETTGDASIFEEELLGSFTCDPNDTQTVTEIKAGGEGSGGGSTTTPTVTPENQLDNVISYFNESEVENLTIALQSGTRQADKLTIFTNCTPERSEELIEIFKGNHKIDARYKDQFPDSPSHSIAIECPLTALNQEASNAHRWVVNQDRSKRFLRLADQSGDYHYIEIAESDSNDCASLQTAFQIDRETIVAEGNLPDPELSMTCLDDDTFKTSVQPTASLHGNRYSQFKDLKVGYVGQKLTTSYVFNRFANITVTAKQGYTTISSTVSDFVNDDDRRQLGARSIEDDLAEMTSINVLGTSNLDYNTCNENAEDVQNQINDYLGGSTSSNRHKFFEKIDFQFDAILNCVLEIKATDNQGNESMVDLTIIPYLDFTSFRSRLQIINDENIGYCKAAPKSIKLGLNHLVNGSTVPADVDTVSRSQVAFWNALMHQHGISKDNCNSNPWAKESDLYKKAQRSFQLGSTEIALSQLVADCQKLPASDLLNTEKIKTCIKNKEIAEHLRQITELGPLFIFQENFRSSEDAYWQSIRIHGTSVTDSKVIEDFIKDSHVQLEHLSLAANQLENIDSLSNLAGSLKSLNLSANKLKSLGLSGDFKQLAQLDLSYNQFNSRSKEDLIQAGLNLSKLQNLNLEGNPLQDDDILIDLLKIPESASSNDKDIQDTLESLNLANSQLAGPNYLMQKPHFYLFKNLKNLDIRFNRMWTPGGDSPAVSIAEPPTGAINTKIKVKIFDAHGQSAEGNILSCARNNNSNCDASPLDNFEKLYETLCSGANQSFCNQNIR